MARICAVCGKFGQRGSQISHAHNVKLRLFRANLQHVKVKYEGKVQRILICTQCLKSNKVERA